MTNREKYNIDDAHCVVVQLYLRMFDHCCPLDCEACLEWLDKEAGDDLPPFLREGVNDFGIE